MIISRSRGFVFIHIQKTAGDSVTKALAPHLGPRDIVLGGTQRGNALNAWFRWRHRLTKHSDAQAVARFLGADWDRSLTFSVVRHPFDRAVSFYHYLEKMLGRRRRLAGLLGRVPGLAYFDPLRWPEMRAFRETGSFGAYIRHPDFGPHRFGTRPQLAFLSGPDGRILVDEIARFESLDEDFARIARRIGLPEVRLDRHNASRSRADGRARLSPADRDLLFGLYRADFDAFGYSPAAA